MHPVVREQLPAIVEICKRHRVRRVAIFGSALRDDFDPSRSDIDLLIDFGPLEPGTHGRQYLGLIEELEGHCGRTCDVVESHMLRNEHVRRAVEREQIVIYDAA